MRDEGAIFGGEVSGHYYFRDFYCADSGSIPALLMLELLSTEGRSLTELMAAFRSRYFISGEINSEVADQEAKMDEIERALLRRRDQPPRRGLGRLPGLALQRSPLQHRAAAAPQPRVARLARAHGREAGRGARPDPRMSHSERVRPRSTPADERDLADGSPTPAFGCCAYPTPFQVGRVNCYLLEDEPLTLIDAGPNSGKALHELERQLDALGPPDRGHRAGDHQPPAHRSPRAWSTSSPSAPARRSRRSTSSCRSSRTSATTPSATTGRPPS